ncbi:MAG: hypothetical protein OQK76_10535 [Gammaproteobacteria bacterium]|nr:hypothetical protein [Gammaproteobacteria bacterium]MCW8911040.1 hypothetical protein [Gammaproteobacteria bacterium]MCW9004530.1 hypothetical protein [Gammaproteobacteria bacterium]MCW9055985.1 hypothetical protein [Gammaproteobacteria bacterium]
MKLHIPEQIPPTEDDFPNHPRKVKKWLAELKQANMGDFAREIYNGLLQLNRQAMPAKYRFENMEQLRPAARYIFNQLQKHFVNRTLPLPEKSMKIINLNQALLNEMTVGYKIIIFESANDLGKVDSKHLLLSCERSLHYFSELLLRFSQVYSEYPKGTWWDIHRIYGYAEQKDFHTKKISDTELNSKNITIENYYKQILLFSLARPNALRQSDAERVYKTLPEWVDFSTLSRKLKANNMNRYFCSKLDSDQPPTCISENETGDSKLLRNIELDKLVNQLRKQINNSESFGTQISIGDKVSQETLRTLVSSWSLCAARRFSRGHRESNIKASIGLNSIFTELTKSPEPVETKSKPAKKPGAMFSLESIPENMRTKSEVFDNQDPSFFITHPNLKAEKESSASAWDMVAKGRTLTESYVNELQAQDDEFSTLDKDAPDLHWQISNVSAGGYCLCWNSKTTSRAQVGELIGIREKEPDHTYQWRVGVIRWMQFTQKNGLEIGIQVLAPKLIPCKINRSHRKKEDPFDGLMLPGIKPIQQPSTILVPAHAFKKDDVLNIKIHDRDMEIKLGMIREHTGSFTQFQFSQISNTPEPDDNGGNENKKESSGKPDDFNSIWSSL